MRLPLGAAVLGVLALIPFAYATDSDATSGDGTSPEVVIQHRGIAVTVDDVSEYLRGKLAPSAYVSALDRVGTVGNSVGNIYLARRVAEIAAAQALLSPAERKFLSTYSIEKASMSALLEREVSLLTEQADWEALAKEEYLARQEEFAGSREVSVAHLLLKSSGRGFRNLMALVSEVDAKLAAGQTVIELAPVYSEDDSVERNGGRLGFIRPGQTAPQFEEAAFSLTEVGEMSEPVLTNFGVHFIELIEEKPAQPIPYESVRMGLIKELKKRYSADFRSQVLQPIRAELPGEATANLDAYAPLVLEKLQQTPSREN